MGRLNRLTLKKAVGGQETHKSQIEKGKEAENPNRKNLYSPVFMSHHGFCDSEASVTLGMCNFDLCPTHMLPFPS